MVNPDCALALAFEGVSLRRRRADAWVAQGEAMFDAPDLRAAMTRLKVRAMGSEGKAAPQVLLILPSDQVLYQRLRGRAAGPDGAAAVREALDGQTPYALSQLRFCFERLEHGGIGFAAVAKETLQEAESFAREQGFNPVGCLAGAEPGVLPHAAWFGLSSSPAEDGWVVQPEDINWAVATPQTAPASRPDPSRLSAAKNKAETAARQAPPLATLALPEELNPEEHARVERLIKGPSFWTQARDSVLRLAWMTAGLTALIAVMAFWPEIAALIDRIGSDPTELTSDEAPSEGLRPAEPTPFEPIASLPSPEPYPVDERDIWTPERGLMRPAVISDLNELVQPALDPELGADAVALYLPNPDTSEPFFALPAPPAPNATFDIDPAGLVRPSPEGAESPDGFIIYEGRPPLIPPARPPEVIAAQEANEALAEATPPEALDASTAPVSPRRRPEGLSVQVERQQLGGRTREELATMRPSPRSAELAAVAAAALAVRTVAVDVAVENAAVDAALASASTAAQTASLSPQLGAPRPGKRPKDVPKAKTTQQRQVAAVAAASTASASASAPASASYTQATRSSPETVTKRATSNRMNLKEVNLLGTFGPTNAQRALIRLPSGRVINVSVGDRVDGGKVAAIGKGELRYVKGGRSHVLTMPRG
ncbi:MAG: hypothetical protein AAGF94_01655 [Pseudomonadota bacterium]